MNFFAAVRSQLLSKIVAGLLVLSALTLSGGFIAGLTGGGVRGQVAFGLFAACAVMSVSVLISLRTPTPVFRVVRIAWFFMAFIVLAIALVLGGEAGDTVLTYAMVALGFPSSLLAAPFVGNIFGELTKQVAGLTMLWFVLLAVGYVQWFGLLARLLRHQDAV